MSNKLLKQSACDQEISDYRLFERVKADMKQHILQAVEIRYLQFLEDLNFGFTDVAPIAMLNHLNDTYGQVTPNNVEINHS